MKRYKNCTRVVRCYRWLRYKPLAYIEAILATILWLCAGAKVADFMPDRRGTFLFLWQTYMGLADYDMGNYVTLEEAITELKDQSDENTKLESTD